MNRTFHLPAALLAVAFAAGCGDAPTEPAALLVAEHARAALDVSVPLPSLAEAHAMDGDAFRAALADLGVWLDAAETRLAAEPTTQRPDLAALRDELVRGRALLEDASLLEEAGDRTGAIGALLGAQSHLITTTVMVVAERRIEDATAAGARCAGVRRLDRAPGSDVAIRRGKRLLAHAREAFAEGDYERALQRGHYAETLLAGECPA